MATNATLDLLRRSYPFDSNGTPEWDPIAEHLTRYDALRSEYQLVIAMRRYWPAPTDGECSSPAELEWWWSNTADIICAMRNALRAALREEVCS